MDVIDRINKIIEVENISRDELCKLTNIGSIRWRDLLNRKAFLRHSEMDALTNALPQYKVWLAFGALTFDQVQIAPADHAGSEP